MKLEVNRVVASDEEEPTLYRWWYIHECMQLSVFKIRVSFQRKRERNVPKCQKVVLQIQNRSNEGQIPNKTERYMNINQQEKGVKPCAPYEWAFPALHRWQIFCTFVPFYNLGKNLLNKVMYIHFLPILKFQKNLESVLYNGKMSQYFSDIFQNRFNSPLRHGENKTDGKYSFHILYPRGCKSVIAEIKEFSWHFTFVILFWNQGYG